MYSDGNHNPIIQYYKEIENAIEAIMDKIASPITSIPGIGTNMAAMIIAEIGDFNNFDSPDKILAFAGLSPSNSYLYADWHFTYHTTL